jgi:hypothetical protein
MPTEIITQTSPKLTTGDSNDILTICPVAHPVCETDFENYYNTLLESIGYIEESYILKSKRFGATYLISDDYPMLNDLKSQIKSFKIDGSVSFTVQFNINIVCHWMIQEDSIEASPSYRTIQSCTDNSWCGIAKIGTVQSTISTKNLKPFTLGKTYNIYLACTNDIPLSKKQSVQQILSFSFDANNNPKKSQQADKPLIPTTPENKLFDKDAVDDEPNNSTIYYFLGAAFILFALYNLS